LYPSGAGRWKVSDGLGEGGWLAWLGGVVSGWGWGAGSGERGGWCGGRGGVLVGGRVVGRHAFGARSAMEQRAGQPACRGRNSRQCPRCSGSIGSITLKKKRIRAERPIGFNRSRAPVPQVTPVPSRSALRKSAASLSSCKWHGCAIYAVSCVLALRVCVDETCE
jgi:hypothetical protein